MRSLEELLKIIDGLAKIENIDDLFTKDELKLLRTRKTIHKCKSCEKEITKDDIKYEDVGMCNICYYNKLRDKKLKQLGL